MPVISSERLKLQISKTGARIDELAFDGITVALDGMIAGRYANRIKKGRFEINGKSYQLPLNDGNNTLHGGDKGFGVIDWKIREEQGNRIVLRMDSPDGDQGFPGRLVLDVEYRLVGAALRIHYTAVSDSDTVVNFTNHAYFNLNGGGPYSEHVLRIDADYITETDSELIPTGRFTPVEGTKYDYTTIRQVKHKYDDNFCLRGKGFRSVAELRGLRSGIRMFVDTDQPGMQIYNTDTHICMETQHFADAPHHPHFPSTLLKAGKTFESLTVYTFCK